jgi:hypothetical protein
MDGPRFDGITRAWATGQTRRLALSRLGGGALAGLLAHLGMKEAGAACVKPGRKGCKGPRHRKCCAGAVCKGGNKHKMGTCQCRSGLGGLTQCGDRCVDLEYDERHCGACDKPCPANHSCLLGKCVSRLGCPAGFDFCAQPGDPALCPGSSNPNCHCVTDVHGTAHCADWSSSHCSFCESNADCGPNGVCFDAKACGCNVNPEDGNGNGCVTAGCDGVPGS